MPRDYKFKDIYSIKELDKGAKFWFNKTWKEIIDASADDSMFEKFKGKTRTSRGKTVSLTPKKAAIRSIRRSLSASKGVWKEPDLDIKLSPTDQAKLKAAYPEFADANFDKYKWGYDTYASKADQSKTSRIRYIVEELDFGGTKAGTLSPEKQAAVIRIFGDEWQGKWNFNSYRYGLPDTGKGGKNTLLMKRIRNTVEDVSKIPEKVGYSYGVDENYLLNKFVEANKVYPDQYKLLKDPDGNLKGVSAKGQNYYHYKYPANLMKPGDKLITEHPSHNKVQKYLKFANEAKGNKSQFLTELFAKHNYKVPTVTQLIRHFWNKEGTTTTRNAIHKHHPGRVENIPDHLQLLDEWKNIDARSIHGRVDNNLMSRADAHTELKRKGIQIILDDGTKLGAPDIDPAKQMRDYEKFAERKVKQVVKAGELPQLAEKLGLIKAVEELPNLFEGPQAQKACSFLFKDVGLKQAKGPGCGDQVREALQKDSDGFLKKVNELPAQGGFMSKAKTVASNILKKVPKGGRLGAILAGAGAVGLGTYAMMGDAEADETRTTDQTMKYNSTTGTFDNTLTGDPEDQEGVLNWIADNPAKAGFSALPAWMGLGYGLSAANMKKAGAHLMSWKAIIPAMMIPEKMHQWKQGMEAGEMVTDPFNALWALGIENQRSLDAAADWYKNLPEGQRTRLMSMKTLKDLGTTQGWKNLPSRLRAAILSPAAAGTDLAFQKKFKPAVKKLTESIIGSAGAKQVAKKGLGALAKRAAIGVGAAALLPATVAAGLVSAPLTLGLGALSFGYAQYKDYRDGKAIVDGMRAKGQISEEDAENYMSLIKQGSLPFGLGNRLWGDDEMTIRGQTFNPEQQRGLLAGMEGTIDVFQDKRKDVRALDRADDFDFFSEGGRVGMKWGGGMDRRGFLKWLAGLGATVIGGASGLFKTGAKKGIEQVVKQAPKQFVGVKGMPAWFPRAVQKIKTHGKLIEMADKDYVNGDIYEMIIPTKVTRSLSGRPGHNEIVTVNKKVLLEENPVSGEIEISWSVDDFDGEMIRQINFKPGESGFQKFGVDPDHPGAWEYQRVKVEEPEFTYGNPDQSTPERDAFDYKDIFEEGDEVVKGLEELTGNKKMVAKDGSIIDTVDEKGVDEAFQKKIFKDIEGEEGLIPDPEGHMTPEGWQGEKTSEVVGGDVPEWVPKDTWQKKARGGTVETGDIARRQSLVPPLSGPDPQGIMGLYSAPKQVRVG